MANVVKLIQFPKTSKIKTRHVDVVSEWTETKARQIETGFEMNEKRDR